MRTIDDYVDLAKNQANLPSDRQLARELGKDPAVISQWRTKRTWPGDDVMVQLAIMAGIDPAEALLELNAWRTEGTTKSLYQSLARKLGTAAALACFFVALSSQAWAMGGGSHSTSGNLALSVGAAGYLMHKLYIMRLTALRLRRAVGLALAKAFARLGFALLRRALRP